MSLLSNDELASIQGDLNAILPGTAILYSPVSGTTSTGGGSISWTAQGTVSADLAPYRDGQGSEIAFRDTSGELVASAYFTLVLPANTTVDATYRVDYASVIYQVATVLDTTSAELERRVVVRRIGGDSVT